MGIRGEKGATGQKGDKGDRGHLGLPVSTPTSCPHLNSRFFFFVCLSFEYALTYCVFLNKVIIAGIICSCIHILVDRFSLSGLECRLCYHNPVQMLHPHNPKTSTYLLHIWFEIMYNMFTLCLIFFYVFWNGIYHFGILFFVPGL